MPDELLNEKIPVQEDLAPVEEPPEETPPVEEPPDKDEPPVKEDDPKGFQERINQIYGQMKHYERENQEKDTVLEELRDHNRKLQAAIDGVRDEISESKRPDIATDPEGYAQWLEEKVARDYERRQLETEAQKKLDEIQTPSDRNQPVVDPVRQTQIAQMEATHGAKYYRDMIAFIASDLKADPMLNREVMTDDNPPAAAFEYAQKKLARMQQRKKDNQQRSFVEDDSSLEQLPSKELSAEERMTAKRLGVSEADYKKQKEYIAGGA